MTDMIAIRPGVVETDRFTIRPMQKSDSGLLERYFADPRLAHMVRDIPHPLPPGTIEALMRRAEKSEREEDFWVIDGQKAGRAEVMGMVAVKTLDRQQSEISYWTAPAFWNMGVASEAVTAMVQANPYGACQMYAEVFQDNPSSARVLTNCGFDYLGDAEAYSVAREAIVATWTYVRKMGT